MGEKSAKGVSDSKTTPLEKKDALGEGEAGETRRQSRCDSRQKLIGLRGNSGEWKKKQAEFGVEWVQTQTKNGPLLFNVTESVKMCYTIDQIKR